MAQSPAPVQTRRAAGTRLLLLSGASVRLRAWDVEPQELLHHEGRREEPELPGAAGSTHSPLASSAAERCPA